MNFSKITRALTSVSDFLSKNAPDILVGLGIAGTAASTILAVKETENFKNDYKNKCFLYEKEEPPISEKIKIVFKNYWPAMATYVASVGCIITGNTLHHSVESRLAEAYVAVDSMYKAYRAKTNALYGDDADQKIQNEIAKDRLKEELEWKYGNEKVLFYDYWGDRYFESSMEEVQYAQSEANRMINQYGRIYLNNLYSLIDDLSPTADGSFIGWTYDQLNRETPYIPFTTELMTIQNDEFYPWHVNGIDCYFWSSPIEPTIIDEF